MSVSGTLPGRAPSVAAPPGGAAAAARGRGFTSFRFLRRPRPRLATELGTIPSCSLATSLSIDSMLLRMPVTAARSWNESPTPGDSFTIVVMSMTPAPSPPSRPSGLSLVRTDKCRPVPPPACEGVPPLNCPAGVLPPLRLPAPPDALAAGTRKLLPLPPTPRPWTGDGVLRPLLAPLLGQVTGDLSPGVLAGLRRLPLYVLTPASAPAATGTEVMSTAEPCVREERRDADGEGVTLRL